MQSHELHGSILLDWSSGNHMNVYVKKTRKPQQCFNTLSEADVVMERVHWCFQTVGCLHHSIPQVGRSCQNHV